MTKRGLLAGAAVFAVFCILRVLLIVKRAPDIDELFTVWISREPLGAMAATLRQDSGPPVYYAILHAFHGLSPLTVTGVRVLSLLFAIATFLMVMSTRWLSIGARFIAVALLSVYSQHLFFSGEARAYALAALAIGAAALAFDRWLDANDGRWLIAGTAALVLAAYVHYYGVLFFPVPAILGVLSRKRRQAFVGVAASAACGLAFVPGFLLAARQPESAIAWMRIEDDVQRVLLTLGAFLRIAFDGRQALPAQGLIELLRVVAIVAFYAAVARTLRSARATRFAIMIATPILAATILAALGRTAYFPIRFESVLSVPVVLWLSAALAEWEPTPRRALLALNLVAGAIASAALLARPQPPPSPQRQVATAVRRSMFQASIPIVTTGVSYLEIDALIGEDWRPALSTYPLSERVHPGRVSEPAELQRDLDALPETFVWIGPLDCPEFRSLGSRHAMRPLSRSANIGAVLMRRTQ